MVADFLLLKTVHACVRPLNNKGKKNFVFIELACTISCPNSLEWNFRCGQHITDSHPPSGCGLENWIKENCWKYVQLEAVPVKVNNTWQI